MDRPIAEIEQRFADLLPLTGQDLATVFDELNRLRTENTQLKAAAAPREGECGIHADWPPTNAPRCARPLLHTGNHTSRAGRSWPSETV